jgi:sec-independent protein translocase protein TatC
MSDHKLIENQEATPVKEMSFLDHLEVLRWMLIRSTIAILIGAVLAFSFKEVLFDGILFGPVKWILSPINTYVN